MRKLNTFMRSLYSFLADPAGHVGETDEEKPTP